MSEEGKVIPGDDKSESGASDNKAYEKLLKEKKNAMTRVQELEAKLKEREEKEMIEKENWKQLAESKETEIKTIKSQLEETNKTIENSYKLNAVKTELSKLGLNQSYADQALRLVDPNRISFDKETKTVIGADLSAKSLYETMPILFQTPKPGVDHSSVSTNPPKKITIEEWKSLPLAEKKKREAELYEASGLRVKI